MAKDERIRGEIDNELDIDCITAVARFNLMTYSRWHVAGSGLNAIALCTSVQVSLHLSLCIALCFIPIRRL